MKPNSMHTVAAALLGSAIASAPAAAQFQSENVELKSNITLGTFGASSGNDCWGYIPPSGREYALMGCNNKVAFVEITDPANPVWFDSVPHTSTTWCDIKVYRDHAYIVTEAETGIQVVDMSDIDNHNITLVRTITNPGRSHNVAIDTVSGFMYTCGSRSGSATTMIFDLSDPGNPQLVGTWPSAYEHDIQAFTYESGPHAGRQILFGSSESRGLDVIDATNKSNVFLVSRTPYPNVSYSHQAWTEDGRYVYLNDELDSIPRTSVFDVLNLNAPVHLGDFSSGLGATDHNNYVKDGFLFCANYRSGLRIFDLNVDPVNPPQVGWFDTHPETDGSGFEGAWSTFPYFPSGTVIVSDINRGLFVLDPSDAIGGRLTFDYPDGRPEFVHPAGGTRMRVQVGASSDDIEPQSGTGILHVDTGAGFEGIAMNDLGNHLYEGVFPASNCGSIVKYFVSAESTAGDRFTDPSGAPDDFFETRSASDQEIVFADDFESDRGWTVVNENLIGGAWERGVPVGGGSRGDPADDFDGSGQCYVTGNAAGDSDVDGGPTRLISPVIDLSAQPEAIISYAAWLSNDDNDDFLVVEVSNNGGGSWTLVEQLGNTGGWSQRAFRVADILTPTDSVRMRFSVADNPNNSVTEAGLDAFDVVDLQCESFAELADLAVLDGTLISGGLAELLISDNAYLVIEARVTGEAHQPHLIRLRIGAVSPVQSPAQLRIVMESRISDVDAIVTLYLRNWNNGNQVQVDQFNVGMQESTHETVVLNAARFVRSGDRRLELEVKEIVLLPFTLNGFHSFIDLLSISAQ